jgi:phosphoribosylformylglycinamidine synthase
MLELVGAPALTPARLEKRLVLIRKTNPRVRALAATFVHFVEVASEMNEAGRKVLDRLLQYGPREDARALPGKARRLLVVPRLGTISPWSSKATDIVRSCGLTAVRRNDDS